MSKKVFSVLSLALGLVAFGLAGAQPLAAFAPENTVLSLSINGPGVNLLETLDDDLSALGVGAGPGNAG